jgi:hypothetical protein
MATCPLARHLLFGPHGEGSQGALTTAAIGAARKIFFFYNFGNIYLIKPIKVTTNFFTFLTIFFYLITLMNTYVVEERSTTQMDLQ